MSYDEDDNGVIVRKWAPQAHVVIGASHLLPPNVCRRCASRDAPVM